MASSPPAHRRGPREADRVGLGWRPELAAGIFANADAIDLVEVIVDDYVGTPPARLRALRRLASLLPVTLHGIGLGLASTEPTESHRIEAVARVIDAVQPESWSEHLAFVRAGGVEIGHLAAPPRRTETIDGTARNVRLATRIVGRRPMLENIATLVEPPASVLDEAEWLAQSVAATDAPLLLDLHNLYANAVNFGSDPIHVLEQLPLDRVAGIHLAGGRWIEADPSIPGRQHRRLLDDHLHDVPVGVFDLLERVAMRAPQPLTVILERDGSYPPVEVLLAQMAAARQAIARGRMQQAWDGCHLASAAAAPQ